MEILIFGLIIAALSSVCFMQFQKIKDLEWKPEVKTPDRIEVDIINSPETMLRIEKLEKALFVKDYLVEIGEAKGDELILKSESVKIKRNIEIKSVTHFAFSSPLELGTGFFTTESFYTSKENYKNHKPLIDEWAKEIKK